MISDNPEGPFEMYGSILKNPGYFFGTGGNNHHCMFEYMGEWYIAYHSRILEDAMDVHGGYRNTNIDKVTFDDKGNMITDGEQVMIGGEETYRAICRECFFNYLNKQEKIVIENNETSN